HDVAKLDLIFQAAGNTDEQEQVRVEVLGRALGDDRSSDVARADLGQPDPPGRPAEQSFFEPGALWVNPGSHIGEEPPNRLVLQAERAQHNRHACLCHATTSATLAFPAADGNPVQWKPGTGDVEWARANRETVS